MKKNKFVRTEKVIDWENVHAEVNKRLKKEYSRNYIQNIWSGLQKSDIVKKELDNILKDF